MVVPASTFGECQQLHQLDNQQNWDPELDSIFYLEESIWFSTIYFLGIGDQKQVNLRNSLSDRKMPS